MRSLVAGVLVGCGGGLSVRGDVDGDPVPLKSGYFAQEDEYFDGGDGVIYVRLSSVDDACAADAAWNGDADDADDAGDLEDIWQENLPEDFWLIDLILRVGDPDDDLDGTVLDGVAWDEVTDKDDQTFGIITHYVASLDQEYWEALLGGPGVDPSDYYDFWYTDGGDLDLIKHTPSEKVKGRFATEVADFSDGDTVGDVEISFSVERCAEMERYLF
jgi:hypothetical protein